jgi:hypothetical protein
VPTSRSLPAAVLAATLSFTLPVTEARAAPAYVAMPAAGPEQVVFSCEGDLWSVPIGGGTAHRLTRGAGSERWARFSPDGKTIAFTATYAGNDDAYTMPAGGGPVTRLTHHPDPDQTAGWTPDGASVVFRSTRDTPHGQWRLYRAPAAGGPPASCTPSCSRAMARPGRIRTVCSTATSSGSWTATPGRTGTSDPRASRCSRSGRSSARGAGAESSGSGARSAMSTAA